MARELKGYAKKKSQGRVPYRYPAPREMRGVHPPVSYDEAKRYQREAARSAALESPWRGGQSVFAA